jgi:hypothetical protein
MDFIPELPLSNGFNNILVIVDKLTKYRIFIPTTTNITEVETTALFFKHVISKFIGMTRSSTTAYHPQADGQTEVLNQSLEISLHAYVGPSRDNWASYLDVLALSYNSMPHTATGYAPAYLL